MKLIQVSFLLLSILFTFSACSTSNVDSNENLFRDQIGLLSWQGSPAVDGAGMLFIVDEVEYGVPGEPDDYADYLHEDENEVQIRADFILTGKETVRGWGATFPEIRFIKIKRI